MTTIEVSKHSLGKTPDKPRSIYYQNLSHGTDMKDRYKHRKIYWFGLWFLEVRICSYSTPN